jgi:hypothetical protein
MTSDKEDSNKQKNEVRKSIQDMDKKFNNLEKKFSRDRDSEKNKGLAYYK